MNKVSILVISNKLDFTTDYVCIELHRRGVQFLRLNRDEFNNYRITLDVLKGIMKIEFSGQYYLIEETTLKSIYYRAPIYLRDIYRPGISVQEQLFRTQWTAFIRNLAMYEDAIWVNNPVSTFKAENKALQLRYANKMGMLCPETIVTNSNTLNLSNEKEYIVKSLDTAVLRIDDNEAFIYSNRVKGCEVISSDLSLAPLILQDYIQPKIDVRVTVIGRTVYTVKILKDGQGVEGDWRQYKDTIDFIAFKLPDSVEIQCVNLVKSLGLAFGGIDLIESRGKYYFIEVNPTGEWAWLINTANLRIYEGICDYLEGKNVKNS